MRQNVRSKGLALLLAFAMTLSLLPVGMLAAEPDSGQPIVLKTDADLAALAGQDIAGTIELAANIDMDGLEMAPIKSLNGLFEGNGYTISNMTIKVESTGGIWDDPTHAALVAKLDGIMQNLTLDSLTISLTGSASANSAAAAFVGKVGADGAALIRCAVTGQSTVTASTTASSMAGGLVGDVMAGSLSLTECYSEAPVTGSSYAGGLVGRVWGVKLTLQDCYASGNVTAPASGGNAGGIIGRVQGSALIDADRVYFSGAASAKSKYGFAYVASSLNLSMTLKNCYYDKDINPDKGSYSKFEFVPGAPSSLSSPPTYLNGTTMVGKTTAEFSSLAEDLGSAFVNHSGDSYPALAWVDRLSDTGRSLTFTVPGATAVTLKDSIALTAQGNDVFSATDLDAGFYAYVATSGDSAKGDATGTLIIGLADKVTQAVLPEKAIDTLFTLTPAHGTIVLKDRDNRIISPAAQENGSFTYALMAGDYTYTAEAFGYKPVTNTITVPVAGDALEVTLEALPTAAVTFTIDCGQEEPTVRVWVKGESLAMPADLSSPLLFNLPAGAYAYQVTAPGFIPVTGELTVGAEAVNVAPITMEANRVWDGTRATALVGKGTEDEPFLISHGRELAQLAYLVNETSILANDQYVNAWVELTADIDLGDLSWTPIGKNSVFTFKGHFDGKGYTIRGLNVDNTRSYYGLFGCLTDATVQNLTVAGEIYCPEPYGLVGGIAGYAKGNVTIRNCANLATISTLARGSGGIGGLIGGYDDNIDYLWKNIRLLIESSYNAGLILVTGSDANAVVGGLVGSNKNCIQLVDCYNIGMIDAPGVRVGGLLGEGGYQTGDDYYPSLTNCYNAGKLIGLDGKTFALYGKGTIGQSRVQQSYALDTSAPAVNNGGQTVSAEQLAALTLGTGWAQSSDKNNGLPYLTQVEPILPSTALKTEADQYGDVFSFSPAAQPNEQLTVATGTVSQGITVTLTQSAEDIQSGYLTFTQGKVQLAKLNERKEAVTETATMRLTDGTNSLRKPISIVIYPAGSSTQTLLESIAATYINSSSEWAVFDMAAYKALNPAKTGTGEAARQNYINLTLNALASGRALSSDRAKAEIILSALNIDTTELYALGAETAFDNAATLRQMNLGTSYYSAPWILLADLQGKAQLTETQIKTMIRLLMDNQGENGLFFSIWGNEKYDDVDTTGAALAALAPYYLDEGDSLGVKAQVTQFVQKALAGLRQAQGSNGSYGNINSDAMVIIGLAAIGESPAEFSKNGCSLADAPLLYTNRNGNGFTSPFISGTQGEKAAALATEQGFRALVALDGYRKVNGAFNIYDVSRWDTGSPVPVKLFARADAIGTPEVPGKTPTPGTGEEAVNIIVGLTIRAQENVDWLASSSITVGEGATVYDLFIQALADNGMQSVGAEDNYIKSISKNGVTLAQQDQGPNSGWMYTVNGKMPSVGLQDYVLKNGDQVLFYYTKDWKADKGTTPWTPEPDATTAPVATEKTSTLTPAASVKDGAATATVTADEMSAAIAAAKADRSTAVIIQPKITGKAVQTRVELPVSSLTAMAADTAAALTLSTPQGNVTVPHGTLTALAAQATGSTVTLTLEMVADSALTEAQQKLVGSTPVFDITLTSGGKAITQFNGKSISIALPYVLKAGETPEGVKVWYVSPEGVLEQMPCTYNKTAGLAVFNTTHLSLYAVGYEAGWTNPFTDVNAADWFYDAVQGVVQQQLFNGTGDSSFSPNASMTRGMLVTVLYRLEGSPAATATESFTDVQAGQWYTDAIAWATANKLVNGYGNDLFGTNDPVTRQQMAAILYRYAQAKQYSTQKTAQLTEYTDAGALSTWAVAAMQWANAEGLITGRTATTLVPSGTATRAEVATILMRFIEKVVQ